MLRYGEKVTNIITGEALLSLQMEGAPVSSESLTARLWEFFRSEENADRRRLILAALKMISVLSGHFESPGSHGNFAQMPGQILYWSALKNWLISTIKNCMLNRHG